MSRIKELNNDLQIIKLIFIVIDLKVSGWKNKLKIPSCQKEFINNNIDIIENGPVGFHLASYLQSFKSFKSFQTKKETLTYLFILTVLPGVVKA